MAVKTKTFATRWEVYLGGESETWALHYAGSIVEVKLDSYVAGCVCCDEEFGSSSRDGAKSRLVRHYMAAHPWAVR